MVFSSHGSGAIQVEAAGLCVQAFPHHGAKRCHWMGRKTAFSQHTCPSCPLWRAMLMDGSGAEAKPYAVKERFFSY